MRKWGTSDFFLSSGKPEKGSEVAVFLGCYATNLDSFERKTPEKLSCSRGPTHVLPPTKGANQKRLALLLESSHGKVV